MTEPDGLRLHGCRRPHGERRRGFVEPLTRDAWQRIEAALFERLAVALGHGPHGQPAR